MKKMTPTLLLDYSDGSLSKCKTPMANQRDPDKRSITMWISSAWKKALQAEADERGVDLSALCIERITRGVIKAVSVAEKPAKKPAQNRTQSNRS